MTLQPKSLIRDYYETIVVCVIFVLFSRAFVFQQSKIPTGSMKDTLLIGDYIMVNKFVYGMEPSALERALLPVKPVERGDVVVFKYPLEPEVDYIKRVIGLPGEHLEIIGGVVHINGVPLKEPYVKHVYPPGRRPGDDYGPVDIPPGHYFCMGDNRDQSADSRIWGFVPRELIKGRALLIWYSFEEDPDAYRKTALSDRVSLVAAKVIHLFDKTRWSRMFSVIR
jgi:signal peptidase I